MHLSVDSTEGISNFHVLITEERINYNCSQDYNTKKEKIRHLEENLTNPFIIILLSHTKKIISRGRMKSIYIMHVHTRVEEGEKTQAG